MCSVPTRGAESGDKLFGAAPGETEFGSADSSIPGTNPTRNRFAAAAALASPAVVSWSVSAKPASPASLTSRARRPGASVPSDAVECMCRS